MSKNKKETIKVDTKSTAMIWQACLSAGMLALFALIYFFVNKDKTTVREEESSPLYPLSSMISESTIDFAGKTGLQHLASERPEAVATIVSWANVNGSDESLATAPLEDRFANALSGTYMEIINKDAYVFIDTEVYVLTIIPMTQAMVDGAGDTVIWIADLTQDAPTLVPCSVNASDVTQALKSTDGLGIYCRAVAVSDESTLEATENALIQAYGVYVNNPPEIPTVTDWAALNGFDPTGWKVYLSGIGASSTSGASVFNYAICFDENTPAVAVVDEEGNPAGESKAMALFTLYGIYSIEGEKLNIPDSLKEASYDSTTGQWSVTTTEEEWSALLTELQAIHTLVGENAGALEDVAPDTE